ncbi:hypothetical protein [Mannheimia haemolytica]|uniref:hypothetical protein n=1 Tax=Mannheimia haemolytica TaxID=75985 RepID=UPI001EFF244D|nr:hypothetical protein [Mannheimia haemolytica]
MHQNNTQIEGKPLIANASTGERYAKSIKRLMRAMHKEALNGIQSCFEAYAEDDDLPKTARLWRSCGFCLVGF